MPRTAFTVQEVKGPHPGTVAANALDYTYAAADVANNNEFAATGRELVLVKNDDVAAQTFTIVSVADDFKRTGDIAAYSLDPSQFAAFWMGAIKGWRQSDGKVYINPSDVDLKFAILRLPV